MGGGNYDEDIALEARSSNRDVFTYRGYGSANEATAAMDVTRSRGDDTRIIYDKWPALHKNVMI